MNRTIFIFEKKKINFKYFFWKKNTCKSNSHSRSNRFSNWQWTLKHLIELRNQLLFQNQLHNDYQYFRWNGSTWNACPKRIIDEWHTEHTREQVEEAIVSSEHNCNLQQDLQRSASVSQKSSWSQSKPRHQQLDDKHHSTTNNVKHSWSLMSPIRTSMRKTEQMH